MLYGAMNMPVRPIIDELREIAELGFDYLELTMDAPQAHYSVIREQKEALLGALDHHGMRLVCHLPTFVSTADLTESLRRAGLNEVLHSIDTAAALHAIKVVLHPSFFGGLSLLVMKKARQYAMESLTAVVERADRLGISLCLENLFPLSHSLVDPEDFAGIFERFPSLKMTLDTGHANIGDRTGKRALDFINRFSNRITHVHASDNFGKEDNHLPIGVGNIDFPRVMRALRGIGYDETITLEVFSRDRDYLRISREKLAAMMVSL